MHFWCVLAVWTSVCENVISPKMWFIRIVKRRWQYYSSKCECLDKVAVITKLLMGGDTVNKHMKVLGIYIKFNYVNLLSTILTNPMFELMTFSQMFARLPSKLLQNWDTNKWLKKVCVAVKSSQSEQNCHPLK